jgi:hypothetical protein
MGFYRNYSSGMEVFEHSEWTGPNEKEKLFAYLNGVTVKGG